MRGAGFELRMAWRDARGSRRSLGLLVAAVALGVAALVAIRSFGDATLRAARAEARTLLGADLVAWSIAPFTRSAESRFAQLLGESGEARVARVASFGAMVVAPGSGRTRLVQVTALDAGYPFYGKVETEPPDAWARLQHGQSVLVDPSLLQALDVAPGATLALGDAHFELAGVVRHFPGDVGVRSALGPRVFIPRRFAETTRLLGFGARVRHEAYVQLPRGIEPAALLRHRGALASERLNLRTLDEDQRRLGESLLRLQGFLSLVGLVALLLGGVGVSSAVHVLVRRHSETIAVLRSLGASGQRVVTLYVVQALGVGLVGGALGTVLGAALGAVLKQLVGDLLPVQVDTGVSLAGALQGLMLGTLAAALFALPPLLRIRHISPLVALRRAYEPVAHRRDGWDRLALALIPLGVAAVAVGQARSLALGLGYAFGLGVAVGVLTLLARWLRWLLRRRASAVLSFAWRQGLAGLHRPHNQTLATVLALGFGTFLLGTLLVVESNLVRDLRVEGNSRRPNLALFDIQPDQLATVVAAVREAGGDVRPATPIVPMRLSAVKGKPVAQTLGRIGPDGQPDPKAWALRREYRSSYRDGLGPAESVLLGSHWAPGAGRGLGPADIVPVSLDARLAEELGVSIGDEVVWDVQGVAVRSRVASLRRVVWARFEPNFFALFPEGPLHDAPRSFVVLTRLHAADARGRLERRVVAMHANVSALDLTDVQRALDAVLERVSWGVRFMALFSVGVGAIVLLGALATSQEQRLREAVLLKSLGATRRQVAGIALAEHACLGGLAAASGLLLALLAGWGVVHFAFETSFEPPLLALLGLGTTVAVSSVALGVAATRGVFRRTAMELLRVE